MLTLFEKPLSGQGCTILQYLCDLDVSLIHQAMLSIRECNLQPCEFNLMSKQVQNVKALSTRVQNLKALQDQFQVDTSPKCKSSTVWSHVWYSDTLKPRQLCTLICFGQPSNSSAVFMTKLHATVWADICLNFWEEWRRNELTGRGGACVNSSIQVLWNWVHNTLQCANSSIQVLQNWVHNTCKDGPLWVPWGNFYRT